MHLLIIPDFILYNFLTKRLIKKDEIQKHKEGRVLLNISEKYIIFPFQ